MENTDVYRRIMSTCILWQLVRNIIGKFVDETKAQMLKDKCLPLEGCVVVAGRTDKGVTALQQVCTICCMLAF
uniref:Uncharacterized protein n=1 Tax=Cucumis melo TaxID=3656 RepID=A0A9I9CV43_CUCME